MSAAEFSSNDREKLRQTFLDQPPETHVSRWESLWSQSLTPWDRSGPSLALKDAILNNPEIFGSPPAIDSTGSKERRKRALVPGCGRGYDVLLLKALGFDAFGLDAAQTAVAASAELTKRLDANPKEAEIYAPPADKNITPGSATFLAGDFFKPLPLPNGGEEETFDIIFDYTFLCALPPSLRPQWSKRMHSLLTPSTGRLICLEFPLAKPPSTGGPPHGLSEGLYQELLGRPGQEVEYDSDMKVVASGKLEDGGSEGMERLKRLQPERTHEPQKGQDFVSIWRRRAQLS